MTRLLSETTLHCVARTPKSHTVARPFEDSQDNSSPCNSRTGYGCRHEREYSKGSSNGYDGHTVVRAIITTASSII